MFRHNLENIFKAESPSKLFFSLLLSGLGYGIYKGILYNYLDRTLQDAKAETVSEYIEQIKGGSLMQSKK